MKTKLVIVNIEDNISLLSHPERFCSKRRLEDASLISDPHRKLQSFAAELALSYALFGEKFTPPDYRRDDLGRPCLNDGYISLSHSGSFAACAYSPVPVGVDIEAYRDVDFDLARRILTNTERVSFNQNPGSAFLLDRFVIKEAYLKMTGEGIWGGLSDIFEIEGRVFRRGVLSGFAQSFGVNGMTGAVITRDETQIELNSPHFQ